MADVPIREFRNYTKRVIERVDAGEDIVITVNGRPAARLVPIDSRPEWMPKAEFLANLRQADAKMTRDLSEWVGDETTADQKDPWE